MDVAAAGGAAGGRGGREESRYGGQAHWWKRSAGKGGPGGKGVAAAGGTAAVPPPNRGVVCCMGCKQAQRIRRFSCDACAAAKSPQQPSRLNGGASGSGLLGTRHGVGRPGGTAGAVKPWG